VLDGNNWTLLNTVYEPTASDSARTRGLYEAHKSRAGVEYQWSMPDIFVHVPASTRTFEMKVRSVAPKPQTITVSAADQLLGKVALKNQSWVTLKYALPAPRIPAANWVRVNVDPSWKAPGTARCARRADQRYRVRRWTVIFAIV
jgi:hypothetical protein